MLHYFHLGKWDAYFLLFKYPSACVGYLVSNEVFLSFHCSILSV